MVISRCLGKGSKLYRFHFKGFLRGHRIVEIQLYGLDSFFVGEDYLMSVKAIKVKDGVLYGKVITSTPLWSITA